LNEQTKHLINDQTIGMMKKGVMLINTSRGGLIDTRAAIAGLKIRPDRLPGHRCVRTGRVSFFRDLSANVIQDDEIQRLMSFSNVLVTAHQAFFTDEAMEQIAATTLNSVQQLLKSGNLNNRAALLV
jgi:D-lactate dehydrogenase